jgi:hypothetical protein
MDEELLENSHMVTLLLHRYLLEKVLDGFTGIKTQ